MTTELPTNAIEVWHRVYCDGCHEDWLVQVPVNKDIETDVKCSKCGSELSDWGIREGDDTINTTIERLADALKEAQQAVEGGLITINMLTTIADTKDARIAELESEVTDLASKLTYKQIQVAEILENNPAAHEWAAKKYLADEEKS